MPLSLTSSSFRESKFIIIYSYFKYLKPLSKISDNYLTILYLKLVFI